VTQDVRQLASVTTFHGGQVVSRQVEQDETSAAIGTLQIPSERAASDIGRKAKKKIASAASSVASATSEFTPRAKRTRGDTNLLAMGKQLEPKVSKKPGKRANSPGSGTSRGRGRGKDGICGSIVETEVNKLNCLEAQAASLAAAEADKATTARSTKSKDIQPYLTTQEDKTGHEAPGDPNQDPPKDSSSSEGNEDLGEKDKAEIDSVSITMSQAL
jgi:hypothetical protein